MSSVDFPAVYANWQAGRTPRNNQERKAVDVSAHIKYTDGQKAALVASADYTGERITVARGPGLAPITVPVRRLAGWHVATRFASGRYAFPRPMIAASGACQRSGGTSAAPFPALTRCGRWSRRSGGSVPERRGPRRVACACRRR